MGILTTRDVISRVMVPGLDPHETLVTDVMSPDPITVKSNYSLLRTARVVHDQYVSLSPSGWVVLDALSLTRRFCCSTRRIRHIPVVDPDAGTILTVLSLSDLVGLLRPPTTQNTAQLTRLLSRILRRKETEE